MREIGRMERMLFMQEWYIRMTERYAKLGKAHMARTGDTAREMWKLMSGVNEVQTAKAV